MLPVNDLDSVLVVPLVLNSMIWLDHLLSISTLSMPGPDSVLTSDKLVGLSNDLNFVLVICLHLWSNLLLGSVPSRVTVCLSFDMQWGTAGYSTSSGFKLFGKTICKGSHFLMKLLRIINDCASAVIS